MTWPDVVTLVLCLALGIVESKRGFVPALFGMIGVILTVETAATVYRQFVPRMSYVAAYLMVVGIGVAIVAVATTLIKRYTQTDIGSFDSSLAGLLGVISGLVLAHAMYGAVVLAYGMNSPVYQGSAFAGQVYELRAWHGFLRFMSKVGTTQVAE